MRHTTEPAPPNETPRISTSTVLGWTAILIGLVAAAVLALALGGDRRDLHPRRRRTPGAPDRVDRGTRRASLDTHVRPCCVGALAGDRRRTGSLAAPSDGGAEAGGVRRAVRASGLVLRATEGAVGLDHRAPGGGLQVDQLEPYVGGPVAAKRRLPWPTTTGLGRAFNASPTGFPGSMPAPHEPAKIS